MTTLSEWLDYIYRLHTKRIDFDLSRMRLIAERLSLCHFSVPVITVGGTNGKGSTVKTLESVYSAAGYRTALYTSPHLLAFEERIRIANQTVTAEQLCDVFAYIEQMREDISLSFFEFTTVAALYLFQQAKPEVVILEVGLGGRLDAVNIVESDIAVVTSIDLDHEAYLGNTREAIAIEKASIARKQKPFICGDHHPPKTLFETIESIGAYLQPFDYTLTKQAFTFSMHETQITLDPPRLKAENVACALAVVTALQGRLPVSDRSIANGVTGTQWPGRFECMTRPFPAVLDVAHNPAAVRWLQIQYAQLPPVRHSIAIVGMLKDKAIAESISPLLETVSEWYVCDLRGVDPERGAEPEQITDVLRAAGKCYHSVASVAEAMQAAVQAHCQERMDRALIFGSFVTVAAAKQWLIDLSEGEESWKRGQNSVWSVL